MGMYCSLISTSENTLMDIMVYPPLVWKVVAPDDDEVYEEAVAEYKPSFFVRFMKQLGAKSELIEETFYHGNNEDEGKCLSLDKDWHAIHFMLTGSGTGGPKPYNFLISGGYPLKGLDNSYRIFRAANVKKISKALTGITEDEFKSRFDPAMMMKEDIYPNVWNRPQETSDNLRSLTENFIRLKGFLKILADAKMGMIVGIG